MSYVTYITHLMSDALHLSHTMSHNVIFSLLSIPFLANESFCKSVESESKVYHGYG